MAAATLVFVHGAWHGAWCWDDLRRATDAAGVASAAVDLPGHGADRSPLADLYGDVAKVRAAIDTITGPVVLVGHSYGGAVITEAGVHERVAQLVYVAAIMLAEGESVLAAAAGDAASAGIDHAGRPSLGAAMRSDDGGTTTTIEPSAAYEIFYNTTPHDRAASAVARLGPQRMPNFGQVPRSIAWRAKPSHYLVCADDNAIHPDLQRILARRATQTATLAADHSPFLSAVDELAVLLTAIAHRAPS